MTPEGKVKAKVKKVLTEAGVWYALPLGSTFGKRGVPDFVACCDGRFLSIETKAGKGKTTALQEYEMQRIRNAGGTAIVVDDSNVSSLAEWLDSWRRGDG